MENEDYLLQVLRGGAESARERAEPTLPRFIRQWDSWRREHYDNRHINAARCRRRDGAVVKVIGPVVDVRFAPDTLRSFTKRWRSR